MDLFVVLVATALAAPKPASAQDSPNCLMCHASAAFFRSREDSARLVVTQEDYAGSVHGSLGLPCAGCHSGQTEFPHSEQPQPADCAACHARVSAEFDNSLHAYALERGNLRAPTCASCHGSHDILRSSDPDSRTNRARVALTCAGCHGEPGQIADEIVKLPQYFTAYTQSVHGQANGRGLEAAATCTDCHGVHNLLGRADPASRTSRLNVAATCGQCHPNDQLEYEESIHGRALEVGISDSPSCTDCHGEHLILSPHDPEAATYAARLATETCGTCHDDPIIIAKYGLEGGVVGSYVDSYHGWASRRDYERAATCVSCHSAHAVLPDEDPTSSINSSNIVGTCQQCHEDANLRFATSYTHRTTSMATNPINRVIRNIYLVLIPLLIGMMVLHNLVIMNYYVFERRKREARVKQVRRLDRLQIVHHLVLTISFVLLVITGFALRFPDAWWVVQLSRIGLSEPVRSTLHRVSGVLLILVGLGHAHYVFFVKRGKEEFRSIRPALKDVKDVVSNMRYHTWRTDKRTRFGRYDYTQKAEYWALAWGSVVMVLTGLILWFPEQTVKLLPSLTIPAAQTIHYYEAWLAALAILVWHFFFMILHPDVYPMSWSWLTGKMSEESVRHHHAQWYEEEIADPDARAAEAPEQERREN